MERSLRHLDALICPSRSTDASTPGAASASRCTHLPYFLPDDYTGPAAGRSPRSRPALRRRRRAAREDQGVPGRHRRDAAPARPRPADRRGRGSTSPSSASRAEGLANVHFEGRLDAANVAAFFRGRGRWSCRRWSTRRSATSSSRRSPSGRRSSSATSAPCPSSSSESGGGLVFDSPDGLVEALDRLAADDDPARRAGRNGHAARHGIWSEAEHLDRYFDLIDGMPRAIRRPRRSPASGPRSPSARHSPLMTSRPHGRDRLSRCQVRRPRRRARRRLSELLAIRGRIRRGAIACAIGVRHIGGRLPR